MHVPKGYSKRHVSYLTGSLFFLALILAFVLFGDSADAQRRRWRRSFDRMERDIFPSNAFTFCRIEYTSGSRGRSRGRRGGSWSVDYPEADENFSLRLSQITTLNVNRTSDGRFQHVVVRLDEPDLFKYPFVYMLEVGRMALGEPEREGLRSYLLRGGFLLVDDFWGDDAWENLQYELAQVLPAEEYPLVDIPLDHEIFHIVFDVDEVPQVPGVGSFYDWQLTGLTYEGHEGRYVRYGPEAHCKGIFDHNGRLMVVVMHNTDLGDGWEREGENYEYFRTFSAPKAYPMGINIVVYAMTH
ncbi:MAG: DUF4159 domain-containing protein [Candidatus Latescibacteria bacterium]|nr:DUF4159 domain-containing protein [Candidatus Latescibacterota bacterium]